MMGPQALVCWLFVPPPSVCQLRSLYMSSKPGLKLLGSKVFPSYLQADNGNLRVTLKGSSESATSDRRNRAASSLPSAHSPHEVTHIQAGKQQRQFQLTASTLLAPPLDDGQGNNMQRVGAETCLCSLSAILNTLHSRLPSSHLSSRVGYPTRHQKGPGPYHSVTPAARHPQRRRASAGKWVVVACFHTRGHPHGAS
ncbi:hypothetical protein C8R47DRAFT_1103449 [Mycena vitilis]|nr:hypothetical protein C8R47DRAFT_1103449 [Mycena vitilis]